MSSIQISNVSKIYKNGVKALNNISLVIENNEFLGLLGPNGAGKSTLIGILSSLVYKTSGRVFIGDYDIDINPTKAKSLIGVVPQEFNFNMFETCQNIVVNQAGYYGVSRELALKRCLKLFSELDLISKRHSIARNLSGGMKRRLMIARALIHNPKILILDEPTAGVDISLRRSLWSFLESANKKGMTIILTTHYLEEAEKMCNRIVILDHGAVVTKKCTHDLLESLQKETFILYCNKNIESIQFNNFHIINQTSNVLEVSLSTQQSLTDIIFCLKQFGIVVNRINNKSNRLEEIFVNMVDFK